METLMNRIELAKAIHSPFCVSNADGVMINGLIAESLARGEVVELSFNGVTRLTTAFLNAAIGQLYDEYDEKRITADVHMVDTNEGHRAKIKATVDNAKRFFLDPSRRRQTTREVMGEDDE